MELAFSDEKEFSETVQRLSAMGYGRMMQIVSRIWYEKDSIGALTIGPCYKQVETYGNYFKLLDENERLKSEDGSWKAISEVVQRENAQLKDENASLSQRLKDYKGCKGVEDYYRVVCDLRKVKAERDMQIGLHRDKIAEIANLQNEIEQLKADKAAAIEALQRIVKYSPLFGPTDISNRMREIARTTLEQLKREP